VSEDIGTATSLEDRDMPESIQDFVGEEITNRSIDLHIQQVHRSIGA
jgi:hypothetical protein